VREQDVDVEHILIDGASTDGTLKILDAYQDYLAHVISVKDEGMYDALNKGIGLATGDVIGILNSDDFYLTDGILSAVVDAFSDKDVDAVYGDLIYVDRNNTEKVVRAWRSCEYQPRKFYHGWMPPHPTFFVRRRMYEQYGLFNLGMGSAADYELMLRMLLKHGIRVAYIPEVLVKMRTGGISNQSLIKRLKANLMDRKAWTVNDLSPYPWTLWMKPIRKIGQWVNK
jgi:glycosyltransferase